MNPVYVLTSFPNEKKKKKKKKNLVITYRMMNVGGRASTFLVQSKTRKPFEIFK